MGSQYRKLEKEAGSRRIPAGQRGAFGGVFLRASGATVRRVRFFKSCSLRGKVTTEPFGCQARDLFQSAGLLEKMRCAGDYLQRFFRLDEPVCLLVKLNYDVVQAAYYQEDRGADSPDGFYREVRASSAGDYRAYLVAECRGRPDVNPRQGDRRDTLSGTGDGHACNIARRTGR